MLSGPTLAAAVASARAAAESLMVDACTITGPPTAGAWDPVTQTTGSTPGPVLYEGPCRVQVPSVQPAEADAGGRQWVTRTVVVSVPVACPVVPAMSVVTVTAAALDPELTGPYRVVAALAKTAASARRLTCEEVPA